MSYDAKDDELVMYIVVRTDLELDKHPGKLAAQVGHAVHKLVEHHVGSIRPSHALVFDRWTRGSHTKIVLGATCADLLELDRTLGAGHVPHYFVFDEGRTVVPENTLTCLAFGPMTRLDAKRYVGHLRLFR